MYFYSVMHMCWKEKSHGTQKRVKQFENINNVVIVSMPFKYSMNSSKSDEVSVIVPVDVQHWNKIVACI